MMKIAALSVLALASTSAFAQQSETTNAPAGAAQPNTAQVSPAPATGAPASDPAATTAQAAPSSTSAQVAAVVEAGFPKYDADKDGKLSEAEFKQWISDLKTQELAATGKPADPAAVSQYASAALAVADKDKDGVVTKQDLTTFLGG
ncbi:MAG: EF-hand domain-containing protein [Sphingobium sp.]